MGEEGAKVTWISCPECGAKIGIILSVGKEAPAPGGAQVGEEPAAALPPSGIKERLAEAGVDLSLVEIVEGEESLTITPKRFLGDLWGPVNEAVRSLGGTWIREGRQSRWEIPKQGSA